jgi:mono/diheme cytochrome c family protein
MAGGLKIAVIAAGALLLAFWLLSEPSGLSEDELPAHSPDPAHGRLVFTAGGCAGCHGSELAGGLEMETPFGVFRVPNISPHPAMGIGNWTDLEFVNAMVRGIAPDGTHYYPAFPYSSYRRMDLADVLDLKAYIDSLPPKASEGPVGHQLYFPWNIRRGLGLWKRRYLDPEPVVETGSGEPLIERGRYLVEGAGHCAECHTPRDRFGGLIVSRWMAGASSLEGEGRAPNITPHDQGIGSWSQADIAYYLKTGFTPDFDTVGGRMVKVQEHLSELPEKDLKAIAAYLKALPAVPDGS